MTPFRDATALEAVPLLLLLTLFTQKNDVTWARHIHIKEGKNINTDNLLLSTTGGINLHDDSFQSESPCKPANK